MLEGPVPGRSHHIPLGKGEPGSCSCRELNTIGGVLCRAEHFLRAIQCADCNIGVMQDLVNVNHDALLNALVPQDLPRCSSFTTCNMFRCLIQSPTSARCLSNQRHLA